MEPQREVRRVARESAGAPDGRARAERPSGRSGVPRGHTVARPASARERRAGGQTRSRGALHTRSSSLNLS